MKEQNYQEQRIYEKPTITKLQGMNFPLEIICESMGELTKCKQCSACHSCR